MSTNQHAPRVIAAAKSCYVMLLHAYPVAFRRRFGRQMSEVFEDRCHTLWRESRWMAVAALVIAAIGEVVFNGSIERISVWRGRWGPPSANTGPALTQKCVGGLIESVIQDARFALRTLRKRPLFTFAAVVTLGLGIGANTAILSVAHGVLLRPLPYHEPERLVDLAVNVGSREGSRVFYGVSDPEFSDLRTEANSFEQIAGYHGGDVTIGDSLTARRVPVMRVTAGMLRMLGVNPHMGRFFTPDEDTRDGSRAIVLSYDMWQREFGGDPNVLGRTMMLHDFDAAFAAPFNQPVPIVGVMPAGFEFPDPHWEAWVPFGFDFEDPVARSAHYIEVVARLKPNVTLASAQSEMNVLAARATEDHPDIYPADRGLTIRLQPYHTRIVGHVAAPLYLLLGAVGFVLLTACVNVANLLLSRAEARKHEIAIRTAVGAASGRLIRQLLTENLILAVLGGLAGFAVASWGVSVLLAIAPSGVPRLDQVDVDGSVLGFALVFAIGTGLAFGVLPALQAARTDVQDVLTDGGGAHGHSHSGQAVRRWLVVAQVAFAVVLATGAGLMLRSIRNVYTADTGFRTDHVLTFRLDPSLDKYPAPELRIAFYRDLLEQLGGLPGVLSAGAAHSLPLNYGGTNLSIEIEGRPNATIADAPSARVQFVTPEYFETLGLTLIRGRTFTRHDDAQTAPVVVVTEATALAHWPGVDPIGKRMRWYGRRWMEVVGVVKDVHHFGVNREPGTWWYVPHAQGYISAYGSPRSMHVVVHADTDPAALVGPIRNVVATFDPTVPISRVQTMEEGFEAAVEGERFVTILLSVFGILAVSLAAVGVHGVISLAVSQRTHEIGLRMALGAPSTDVLLHVIREGLVLSLAGVIAGLLGSVVMSRGIDTMVFGITPTDPVTYGGVALLLTGVAVGASLIPARRATRVDPVEALRRE